MTDRRRSWLPWLLLLFLLAVVLWKDHGMRVAQQRAEAQTDSARTAGAALDSLRAIEVALTERYGADTVAFHDQLAHWQTLLRRARGQRDTLWMPGTVDTLAADTMPVPVGVILAVADSTIRACTQALGTCEQRVAAATERGDSAESAARHWQEAATQWKRVAKGPLLRLAVEGTVTPDLVPQVAGDLTLGRGHLRALARFDVGQGAETCAFLPNTEAYACSSPWIGTARVGARWVF